MSDEQASEGKWDSINQSNSSVYGSHSPCDLPHFNFKPANYVAYMLKNIKTRLDWWWVALKNNRKHTQWQTRFVREAGCIGRSKSRCSVTGLPTDAAHQWWGKGTRAKGEGGMVGDTRRKTGGTGFLLFALFWHVAALTDSRPGDRAGWLVLCRSDSGHGSAVSALTEIPTPWSLAHILIACNSQTHSRSPQH